MRNLKYIVLLLASITTTTLSHAQDDVLTYDEIVDRLSPRTRTSSNFDHKDPFEKIKIHAGVAITSSFISIVPARGKARSAFLKGVEANCGIDLFTDRWVAEGAVRSFNEEKLNKTQTSLKEFDLRIIYRPILNNYMRLRTGFGISGRYLNYKQSLTTTTFSENPDTVETTEILEDKYTTPATVFLLGVESYVSQSFSVGLELAYRSSLIDETADKNSFDGSVRIGTHF